MTDDESPYVSPEDEADFIENGEKFIDNVESCALSNSKNQLKFSAYEINFGKSKVSLQKAFLEFKWKKSKELIKHVDVAGLPKNSEEDKLKLRSLFVEQAKKYIGVPYSKKYWSPEDKEFHAPLFLDCCGLVRRVMLDLKREFGFCLGPWNQSYQHDTLPITLQSLDEVKPGDLVFTSATYYKPREKPQKHDLTHVEILLGSGARTIASRWRKGKVQEFDDYRFESTVYHSPKYIFKSIETWIQGICKSHCEEHKWVWKSELFIPTDKSIFSSKYDCDADNDLEQIQNEMEQSET